MNLEAQFDGATGGRLGRLGVLKPEVRQSYILLCVVLWSAIAFLFIHRFVLSAVVIDGRSMLPTLFPGEQCLVNGWLPFFREYQRGDLVVIRDETRGEFMVKRIVGMPNERVRIKQGKVFVNDTQLREPYLSRGTVTDAQELAGTVYKLSAGEYFVLGDNRPVSEDSRFYGAIDRSKLVGLISH
jgi:signal peptidase I